MKVSIVIPSKGCQYLGYALKSLKAQVIKPYEVILILKECEIKYIEAITHSLDFVIVEQKRGFFTHALNLGKREARGDIIIFTDDDVILPKGWIKRYLKLHTIYRDVAGIGSRDIYLDLNSVKLSPTPDDKPWVRLFRWTIRPVVDKPHPLLSKYRLGVYITKNYRIAHGPCIPYRICYSLPLRGANMSFKAEYIHDAWFPEHPRLVRAPGNEQYFALQLILKGFDTIYVPNNPVIHIMRKSLSRMVRRNELTAELKVMRSLIRELIKRHGSLING